MKLESCSYQGRYVGGGGGGREKEVRGESREGGRGEGEGGKSKSAYVQRHGGREGRAVRTSECT